MILSTPLSENLVLNLTVGDIVYLNGVIYTARDEAHIRVLEYLKMHRKLPINLKDNVIFHCGPITKKIDNEWVVVSAGPTTSSRMNDIESEFIEKTGIKGIIGKGGMSGDTIIAMKKYKCVYFAITGGAAVVIAKHIKKIREVHWLDLGMPEAIWVFECENLGPLIVAIDVHGNSLFEKVTENVRNRLSQIL
jgi:fumarate hydratase subunit beta